MEYIKSEEANEDLLFREEVMRQFEYFYQYMHGDRKEPNEVETIFKRSIEFFGADWIGLIDFDLEVGAWSTRCFYNKRTGSSTETLIEDAENAAQAKRWEQAIRGGKPIVIEDRAWVAAEAFVGPGVTIGEGAVVGARGCVFKDVEPWTVVGGNPARFIKQRTIKDE